MARKSGHTPARLDPRVLAHLHHMIGLLYSSASPLTIKGLTYLCEVGILHEHLAAAVQLEQARHYAKVVIGHYNQRRGSYGGPLSVLDSGVLLDVVTALLEKANPAATNQHAVAELAALEKPREPRPQAITVVERDPSVTSQNTKADWPIEQDPLRAAQTRGA